MNRRPVHICLLALIVAALMFMSACEQVSTNETAAASELLGRYLKAIEAGRFDEAAALYLPKDREDRKAFLEDAASRLGRLVKVEVEGPETHIVFSGKFYIFTVDGEYERGSTDEVITLFQGVKDLRPHLTFHKIRKEHHGELPKLESSG